MIDLLHPQYVYDQFPGHHLPPLWQAKRVPREADEIREGLPRGPNDQQQEAEDVQGGKRRGIS